MNNRGMLRPLIVLVCAYLIITTVAGTVELLRSGDKVTRREKVLAGLLTDQKSLIAQNRRVQTQGYLEQIAYEKLGLSRPGEKVIIVPSELLADNEKVVKLEVVPNWKKWVQLLL